MNFFGLDIGSHKLKLVQLQRQGKEFKLVALGSSPATAKGLFSEAEADLVALSEAIKKIHTEAKITTKNVAAALPQDQIFTQVISLPKLSQKELKAALKWEAEQYVPLPLEDVTLAHQIVGQGLKNAQEKTEVLLVAAPNRLIDKMVKVLQTAGLRPVSLETEIISMARSLVRSGEETVLLIDLGARATDLAVVEKGQVIFTQSVPTAGEALTRAVATELGLEANQAEAYKKAYGADPKKLEGKIRQAIGPLLESLVKEMEKTIQFYQAREKGNSVKQVILTGGTAGLPEVASLLTEKLNLEIQMGNPFSRFVKDDLLSQLPASETPFYAVAVGLAMKEIS